ncbi:MAG: response regulator transcription factor [Verrucomicrobia bacterium]|nr:response regulator transcription factor [Verrucomicrobiota bacterium]
MKSKTTALPRASAAARLPRQTRIVLVDDHPLVRERLAQVIQEEPDLTICGEAADRHHALRVIADTKPDLAIVDLVLKNSHGLELIKDLATTHPKVAVLVVSLHEESLYAERAMRAGAKGYITKQEATRNILVAIRRVLAGGVYLSRQTAERIAHKMVGRAVRDDRFFIDRLTDRELQVFEAIGNGLGTGEIAALLGVEFSTVETYRSRLKEKLQLRDASELLRQAIHWKHSGNVG